MNLEPVHTDTASKLCHRVARHGCMVDMRVAEVTNNAPV
jgi:hypothetical protein